MIPPSDKQDPKEAVSGTPSDKMVFTQDLREAKRHLEAVLLANICDLEMKFGVTVKSVELLHVKTMVQRLGATGSVTIEITLR